MAIFYDWGDSGAKKAETNIYLDLKTNKKNRTKEIKMAFSVSAIKAVFSIHIQLKSSHLKRMKQNSHDL